MEFEGCFLEEGAQAGAGFGVVGVDGQIVMFVGVFVVIVELGALFSAVPFGVAPAFGADAAPGKDPAGVFEAGSDLGEGGAVP